MCSAVEPIHRESTAKASHAPRGFQVLAAAVALSLVFTVPPRAARAASGPSDASAVALVGTVCATCHGADGRSIAETFPHLAGQTPEYLEKQLRDYVHGKRRNDAMSPFLPQLRKAHLSNLARHYSAMSPQGSGGASAAGATPAADATPVSPAPDPALRRAGERLFAEGRYADGVPACSACHGPAAAGADRMPALAGQYPSYIAAQLTAFRHGERSNDTGRVMRNIAAHLSDADVAAVAAYLGSLKAR
jgi:cytochrome c553